jgi:hypothetical protein
VTDDSAFKKQVRARMAGTGEKYTVARRMVIAERDPGQPPVVLRVYPNPHLDLELTGEAARAYAAADEPGRREMASRLLADHLEMAGAGEAGVAAGSDIMAVQALASRRSVLWCAGGWDGRPGYPRSMSAGTWTRSGLISRLPGRAWCRATAARRPAGSALSWRN